MARLVLGNKNEMDQDLTQRIILRGILIADRYLYSFRGVQIGIKTMTLPIGTDPHFIIKIIRGLIQIRMILENILFVIGAKNLDTMLIIVQILRNHRIMFLCVVTARQQDTPQMSVPILKKITHLTIGIGRMENE